MTSMFPFTIEDPGIVSAEFCQNIQQLLLRFAQEHPALEELLVATADGYEVAAMMKNEEPGRLHKIAAMTSSLSGIGVAMLNEIGGGEQKTMTLEGGEDYILLWQIPFRRLSLCLTAVASTQEPLGQLFWLLRQLVSTISELDNLPQETDYE